MIEIIPAIDIIDGKCVRLSQGNYANKKIYNEDPLEVAKSFEDNGITRLHLVDLDGAKSHTIINYKTLEKIARHTNLIIDFGGGLKQDSDVNTAFDCGAHMITGGSIAVKNPEIFEKWIRQYGSKKVILGADVHGEHIAIGGWLESTEINLFDFLESYIQKNISKVICTDISKDGMLQGSNVELYTRIKKKAPSLYCIASGGVASLKDIIELDNAGIDAVITGKAIYEGGITLHEIQKYIT
ncbi:MAG: 1-(5-phosphoribosyl)-5-[(5-phosphoribosylamino)methylideneamino]imidazole-4-carboxamide isomerase [Bacteroidales bacterium]|jgi:phosphoribosylformimino-5-aminoimidazole carboxamide ribotide isomerase|nr:1-(5-phosphoribosyl)-5-[(5-phosphoribosylamino)methylideneamino]imidazole-4-carboxamide isomerase [Bacteroidales bacterium]